MMKRVMILDGQGGGMGRKIAERLLAESLAVELIAVGTNAAATSNMMKAGVGIGATGENACIYNAARADIIIGPFGIIFPHAMHGEISPAMALAVAESAAERILIPVPNHHLHLLGLTQAPLGKYLDEAVETINKLLGNA